MHVTYINRNVEGTSHFVKETARDETKPYLVLQYKLTINDSDTKQDMTVLANINQGYIYVETTQLLL